MSWCSAEFTKAGETEDGRSVCKDSPASIEGSMVLAITPWIVHLKSLSIMNHVMISVSKYRVPWL